MDKDWTKYSGGRFRPPEVPSPEAIRAGAPVDGAAGSAAVAVIRGSGPAGWPVGPGRTRRQGSPFGAGWFGPERRWAPFAYRNVMECLTANSSLRLDVSLADDAAVVVVLLAEESAEIGTAHRGGV
jgi:hypothetical protein